MSVSLESDVSNGTLNFNADGSFSYLSAPGFVGTDSFRYRATDGTDNSSFTTVTLNVNLRPNDAPVVVSDQYLAEMDTVLSVDALTGVLSNDSDADNDPFTAVLDTNVSSGVLALNPDGSFIYTPSNGFSGTDTFRYFATDNPVSYTHLTLPTIYSV